MDSRSRRLPFCLPSSRSSYTSSPAVSSSSSLGASRLYSRDTGLNNDSFPRASSAYKSELDQQNSRLLRSSRDYSSSDSHCSSWKFPSSLTSSSRSYERPSWTESSLSSRSKQTDSEGRLGMRSVLLNATDDGDSKRAKLSYNNRGLYSRTPSTSVTGSTYSSNGLSSSRGAGEKQSDKYDSSWRSSLLSRRESEPKTEPSLSSLGERRNRTPGLTSSLYQTDRVTSTYAQGARPKETTYSPSSSSSSSSSSSYSMTRDSSLNRHFSPSTSHRSSPALHDFSSRPSGRVLNSSSSLRSSQEPTRTSNISSSYLPRSSWHSTPAARTEVLLPPRPAPEGAEQEGRRSTCRLLSRLFSRRTSQDSSSGSSSVRSLDDESSTTGGESADSDEGARMASVDPVSGGSEATVGGLRNRRIDLAPIQESNSAGYRSSMARSQTSSWREAGVSSGSINSSSGGSSGSTSWLSSSLRGRCPPLLARLRRHARNDGAHSAAGLEEGYSRPERLLRTWDNLERKTSPDDDDDDDDDDEDEEEEEEEEEKEEDKEEGAVGLGAFGAGRLYAVEEETLPELENSSAVFSPLRRSRLYENFSASLSPSGGTESQLDSQREKPVSSRDQEKLRKIKERLLLEDSDEDEGDLCRICQMGEESQSNPLIQPCRCTGSLQYVHQECIKRWLRSKIGSGTNFEAITTCELCKQKLRLNIDNFDIQELYRTHVQSEYDEFISSGLYLVVLLHFCEQRFSDVLGAVDAAGLFNLVRILHEHMDNLEIPHNESDEEVRDNRPSIEFSDLDDDLEEEY